MEDQSEEIQRLNQVIKDLKEDNLKLSSMNAKLCTENEHFKKLQKLNEATVKSLRNRKKKQSEENETLRQEIDALKCGLERQNGSS